MLELRERISSTQSACLESASSPLMSIPPTMASASLESSSFNLPGRIAKPITSISPMFSFFMWCSSACGWKTPSGCSSVVMLFLRTKSISYFPFLNRAIGFSVLCASPSVSANMNALSSV